MSSKHMIYLFILIKRIITTITGRNTLISITREMLALRCFSRKVSVSLRQKCTFTSKVVTAKWLAATTSDVKLHLFCTVYTQNFSID